MYSLSLLVAYSSFASNSSVFFLLFFNFFFLYHWNFYCLCYHLAYIDVVTIFFYLLYYVKCLFSAIYSPDDKHKTALFPAVPETSNLQGHYLNLDELLVESIIWVDEVEGLLDATRHIEGFKVIGLDCEWKPNYIKGSKPNKVNKMIFLID